jgi:uncharacterized protein YcbK (DUF882 family)
VAALSALAGALGFASIASGTAPADTREISFFHIHTKETLTVVYKRNGKYVPDALRQINWIMRDWRRNESVDIDPKAIDLIWEMHSELGSREPVHIICGYRSRETNEMLRRTVGGQASQSQHITGKAVDVSFPDVPVRQMRYSALVRERGGVGYYPTSAIPFVHVDTGRVRHWPRLPRDELALLFPSGHSKHEPADGGPLTPADVAIARRRSRDTAQEVARYFDVRARPKAPVLVADASGSTIPVPPSPKPARPPAAVEQRIAVGAPTPALEAVRAEPLPKLVAEPRLVDRPARFAARTTEHERARLDMLVTLAALEPPLELPVKAPAPPSARAGTAPLRSKTPLAGAVYAGLAASPDSREAAAPQEGLRTASLAPPAAPADSSATAALDARTGWASAPAYDEEHPEELSYRPFPLAPLLTASPSLDDPVLATMVHPNLAETLEVLDDAGSTLPMRLRPGRQIAGLLWAQEFRGEAVSFAELDAADPPLAPPAGLLANRSVTTMPR